MDNGSMCNFEKCYTVWTSKNEYLWPMVKLTDKKAFFQGEEK